MFTPRTIRPTHLPRVLALAAATVFLAACAVDPATAPLNPVVDAPLAAQQAAAGRVTHYDIMDWVLAQGSFCQLPENEGGQLCGPPVPGLSISGWSDPTHGFCGFIDYAGFATRYLEQAGGPSLGTTYGGSITERLLNDGRAEVTIILRTNNALAFELPCAGLPSNPQPLLFGAVPTEILAGAEPVVGSSFFSFTYIAPPGYPFPEPIQLFTGMPPYELVKIAFHAEATGPLHAASGFGEGTLGRMQIQQVGRVTPGLLNREGDYPNDIFPVEYVRLGPVGR
jgi:hypothetical protein